QNVFELGHSLIFHHFARHHLGVASEQNIGSATRHVGGDRHSSETTGLSNDLSFAFVVFGIENVVLNACPFQKPTYKFRLLNAHSTNQHWLAFFFALFDVVQNSGELGFFSLVHHIVEIFTSDRSVGGNHRHIEIVDLLKFNRFSVSSTRHAAHFAI